MPLAYERGALQPHHTTMVSPHLTLPPQTARHLDLVSKFCHQERDSFGSSTRETNIMTSTASDQGVPRGAFIVLEGLDRSGKTTQVKLLEQRLAQSGKRVQVMRFPGETSRRHFRFQRW